MHLTVMLAGHDWRIWGGLQNVLQCNGISGSRFDLRTLISATSFRWRDILFLSYINFESFNDRLGFEILLHGGFLLGWAPLGLSFVLWLSELSTHRAASGYFYLDAL